jgi:hypothetical protein
VNEKPNASLQIREILDRHDLAADHPTLILGQRLRSGEIVGGKYPTHPEMASRLRGLSISAKAKVDTINMSEYDGATMLDPEHGLWVPADRLRQEAPLLQFLAAVDDEQEPITADEAQSLSLSFYAIAFGPDDDRISFVREKAQNIHGRGKIFGLLDGPMRLISAPILSLDTNIDFITTDAGAVVFTAHTFERFIQDPAEIAGSFEQSLHQISDQLPLDGEVLLSMKGSGTDSLSMRGRVRSILGRPYFPQLTIALVREKIISKKLDPDRFIEGDHLKFEAKDTMLMLKLLDQKIWRGDFDDTLYSTNSATPEQP